MQSRTSSGIMGLDPLIEGGFPKGSLIIVAGNPGTGKTALGCSFLYHGASELGEEGVYVSFAESKATLYQNAARMGFDFEALEKAGKIKFLDLISVKREGMSTTAKSILEAMSEPPARRLFLDSFTAMSTGFADMSEARAFLHSLLNRFVRQMGCTTMLVVETPVGLKRLGTSVEEFVADCVIVLSMRVLNGRIVRELKLLKLRGTELSQHQFIFTLSGCFKVFPPFTYSRDFAKKRFVAVPDPEGYFSTGSSCFDRILGGGYVRGSNVLFELGEGVPAEAYRCLIGPTIYNFVSQGRPSIMFPSESYSSKLAERDDKPHLGEENFYRLFRICERKGVVRGPKPNVVEYDGRLYEQDLEQRTKLRIELEDSTGQPSLGVWAWNRLEQTYGSESVVRGQSMVMPRALELGRLNIYFAKPGFRYIDHLRSGCQYHLILEALRGAVFLYGQKPFFKAYVVEEDVSRGYPEAKLTPLE